MEYLQLILGLTFLIIGGDFLVKGAVSISLRAKISPLVVGMTVVSFGTSAPELLVSLNAVLTGHPDVATGAVIGSNISNLGLVLGATLLIFPIIVKRDSLRIDWPMMMTASMLFYVFAIDQSIERWEGIVFVVILLIFTTFLVIRSRIKGRAMELASDKAIWESDFSNTLLKDGTFFLIGIVGLYFGSEWLIDAVVEIARESDVSEKLISVTLVAFGTSVPELATSIIAAFKKETDISIGNLIGSNIFNILAILGITAIVHPIEIAESINSFDIFVMLGISFVLLPLMRLRRKMNFWAGIFLLLFYFSYIFTSISPEI